MKFSQLIEYNIRNIFLQKLYTKCGGEATPRLFYKKSKLSISIDQHAWFLKKIISVILTDQISLLVLSLLRYWAICLL